MSLKGLIPGLRAGPSVEDVLRMYAVSRLMLHGWIHNIQLSWVKQGLELARRCLDAGANDFGGTLINESISTAAGAQHGQFLRPSKIRGLIREAGRLPAERSTTYQILRTFESEPDEPEVLDRVADAKGRFGSYHQLVSSGQFRFRQIGVKEL